MKGVHEAEDGAEEAEQRGDLGDGGEEVELFLEAGDFGEAGLLDGFADAVTAFLAVDDGGLDEAGDRSGGGVADGDGLDDVFALENGADAVEEFGGVNLGAVAEEGALDKDDEGDDGGDEDDPDDQPAMS